jgi:hypothetical protein
MAAAERQLPEHVFKLRTILSGQRAPNEIDGTNAWFIYIAE